MSMNDHKTTYNVTTPSAFKSPVSFLGMGRGLCGLLCLLFCLLVQIFYITFSATLPFAQVDYDGGGGEVVEVEEDAEVEQQLRSRIHMHQIGVNMEASITTNLNTGKTSLSPAQNIILSAYNETFSLLTATCDRPNEREIDCFKRILYHRNRTFATFPWWFHTMLRDATINNGHGLHGNWHNFSATNPDVRMCSIEKIATTQWRKVFTRLNDATGKSPLKMRPFSNELQAPLSTPQFVFLRDPLERFLSAYMDKCIHKLRRVREKHCEPNLIFNNPETTATLLHGLQDIESSRKAMFAAYVDVVPLKWNMHFFPQSWYCNGLFRFLKSDYAYVGNMGAQFYSHLQNVSTIYGGRFADAVNEVFDLQAHVQKEDVFVGVKTASPKHVHEYYTKRSLTRVLEYVSMDYVLLGLEIPAWAEKMLQEEDE